MNIRTFLENSLKLIENQTSEANIRIQTRLDAEVDEILADPDRIKQVFLNLYLNAMESMKNGGNLTVWLLKNEEKDGIKIRVQDTGTGINEDDLTHIFDPYFTTKVSGTGLGLAIAHNIIEAHNGEIRVHSRLDQGTTVTILLPYT